MHIYKEVGTAVSISMDTEVEDDLLRPVFASLYVISISQCGKAFSSAGLLNDASPLKTMIQTLYHIVVDCGVVSYRAHL